MILLLRDAGRPRTYLIGMPSLKMYFPLDFDFGL